MLYEQIVRGILGMERSGVALMALMLLITLMVLMTLNGTIIPWCGLAVNDCPVSSFHLC